MLKGLDESQIIGVVHLGLDKKDVEHPYFTDNRNSIQQLKKLTTIQNNA